MQNNLTHRFYHGGPKHRVLRRPILNTLAIAALGVAAVASGHPYHAAGTVQNQAPTPSDPPAVKTEAGDDIRIDPRLTERLQDEFTPADQKLRLAAFHGLIPEANQLLKPAPQWTPEALAIDALARGDYDHPSLRETKAPRLIAQRLAALGHRSEALAVLQDDPSLPARADRADLLLLTGDTDAGITQLKAVLQAGNALPDPTAADLHAMGRSALRLAEWTRAPGLWQTALDHLGAARNQADPFYWPAYVEEGKLLLVQSQGEPGVQLLTQALSLNPRAAEPWFEFGRLHILTQRFDEAQEIIHKLQAITPDGVHTTHLKAMLADATGDPATADQTLTDALARWPDQPGLLQLQAEFIADRQGLSPPLDRAIARADPHGSHHPEIRIACAGRLMRRGYFQDASTLLQQILQRTPDHAQTRSLLGQCLLMLDAPHAAATELKHAAELNPFDLRTANRLTLARAIDDYDVIETDHFIIRYRPGIDEAFARDLADGMESIVFPNVTQRFNHVPLQKTGIHLMPDQDWFSVRLTGMPDFWTFAAAVGHSIVVSPPRHGKNLRGTYDWVNVLTHEYTHTVTLDLTHQRVPRWFTEGAAVNMELPGRTFSVRQALAQAVENDTLLPLSGINRPFIFPKQESERGLAYAQSAWMLEYLRFAHGDESVDRLHDAFARGLPTAAALEQVLGIDDAAFENRFKAWAADQTQAWGVVDSGQLTPWRTAVDLALNSGNLAAAEQALAAYRAASPTDPWVHEVNHRIGQQTGNTALKLESLAKLSKLEHRSGDRAYALAKAQQQAGNLHQAVDAAVRATHREPYNGDYRELAAVLQLQNGHPEKALVQLKALTLIEPEQSIHWVRYAALLDRLGRAEEAQAARARAAG